MSVSPRDLLITQPWYFGIAKMMMERAAIASLYAVNCLSYLAFLAKTPLERDHTIGCVAPLGTLFGWIFIDSHLLEGGRLWDVR
jgi:hypothetical protein